MRYVDLENYDRPQVAYLYLISQIKLFKETLDKVTLYSKKNSAGQLYTSITTYLADTKDSLHTVNFKFFDDEYIWFLNSLSLDFPDAPLEDLREQEGNDGT